MLHDEIVVPEEVQINTPTNASIDYEQMSEAFYDALSQYYEDKGVDYNSDVVSFDTGDDRLLTCTAEVAPTSSAQQAVTYLLDIRNVLLLFLITYFLFTTYSKLKNLIFNYYKGD